MDYNRVQSYIKSHVLPKLDNLDATISSRASSQQVDGVRGGWTLLSQN